MKSWRSGSFSETLGIPVLGKEAIAEAVAKHHSRLLWRYLAKYKLPAWIQMQGNMTMNPLVLALQFPYFEVDDHKLFPPALPTLLYARCSLNTLEYREIASCRGSLTQRLGGGRVAAGFPGGFKSGCALPGSALCIVVRQHRRGILKALLVNRANVEARSLARPTPGSRGPMWGATVLELPVGTYSGRSGTS